jgi:hypothetical protein
MPKNKSKARAQRRHFKMRLLERYGILCNNDMYRSFISQVKKQESKPLLAQSRTRVIHEIYYEDRPIWVVYDKKRHEFCTALPYIPEAEVAVCPQSA